MEKLEIADNLIRVNVRLKDAQYDANINKYLLTFKGNTVLVDSREVEFRVKTLEEVCKCIKESEFTAFKINYNY